MLGKGDSSSLLQASYMSNLDNLTNWYCLCSYVINIHVPKPKTPLPKVSMRMRAYVHVYMQFHSNPILKLLVSLRHSDPSVVFLL